MALEIERRFLVRGDGWRRHVRRREHFDQGYLQRDAGEPLNLRVRLGEAGRAWLTLKARPPQPPRSGEEPAPALTRLEFEYVIPPQDARDLLGLAPHRVEKIRSSLTWPGGDWVVDEFLGENAPLCLCEVELPSASAPLARPDWCGPEVTHRRDLSNAALARQPLACWNPEARRALEL